MTITVQEPASDAWVQRTPGANEKPVNNQFFARDPTPGSARSITTAPRAARPPGLPKVYTTDTGTDVLYATHRQTLVGGAYAFTAPIAAGKVTYKVVFGTTTGGVDTNVATVTDLVCGDAYIIEASPMPWPSTTPRRMTSPPTHGSAPMARPAAAGAMRSARATDNCDRLLGL